jgi:hypothetical protein
VVGHPQKILCNLIKNKNLKIAFRVLNQIASNLNRIIYSQ